MKVDIILAATLGIGKAWARGRGLIAGRYMVISPRTVDVCRGAIGRRLFVLHSTRISAHDWEVLKQCFAYSKIGRKRYHMIPIGDRHPPRKRQPAGPLSGYSQSSTSW